MARYHKNLKYHEDTVEKHSITEEELKFLKDLQNELNTQDYICQADPRFWVIKGSEKLYHVEEADGYELYDPEGCDTLADDIKGICEYINENLLEEINEKRLDGEEFTVEFENALYGYDQIVITWNDGGVDEYEQREELTDVNEIQTWLSEQGHDYQVISYKIVPKIYEDTMFLTQIDTENHLKANHYHYSEDAHTYAMTAWRDWRMEKLIKILQQVDWK